MTIGQVTNVTPSFITQLKHVTGINYFQVASLTILIYDHMLTFAQEVDRIWHRPFTGASVLFVLNRYVTPVQFIVSVDAHNDPSWTKSACIKYAPSQGSMATAMVAVCELIMILRVYALYGRNKYVLGGLMFLWVVQVVISSIGLTTGHAIQFTNGIVGCILSGDSKLFPVIWITPLITDFTVFMLTLYRSREYFKHGASNIKTLKKFVRDGTVYFFVICMANLLNVMVYFLSPANDLRTLGASFSQIITSIVISRMVLNLRSETSKQTPNKKTGFGYESTNPGVRFIDRAMGGMGEEDGISTDQAGSQGIVITRTEVIHSDSPMQGYGLDEYALSDMDYKRERKAHAV